MSNVLITGSLGFVGRHLCEELKDDQVIGFDLRNGQDLRDFEQIRDVLDNYRPDYIYHLAAQAYVPESVANPQRAFEINTIGSLNLLEAVRQLGLKSKILLAGTSEEYGDGNVEENSELHPRSPYAISKMAMDRLGILYAKSYGMDIVVTRAFNHTGPGRGEMYAESAWAKQIVEIEKGKRAVVEHGNLDAYRNYTDVRDMVKAYSLAINLSSGVYNICHPKQTVKMSTVFNMLSNLAGGDVRHKEISSLMRPADFSFKVPSCEKFMELTDWKPEIKLKQTLSDLLDYWRQQV